jgi:hypothetical protein
MLCARASACCQTRLDAATPEVPLQETKTSPSHRVYGIQGWHLPRCAA